MTIPARLLLVGLLLSLFPCWNPDTLSLPSATAGLPGRASGFRDDAIFLIAQLQLEGDPPPVRAQNADDDPDSPEHTFLGGPDPPCMLPCGIVMLILILVALVVALALAVLAVVLALVLLFVSLLAAAFMLAFGIVFVAFLVLAALVLCAVLVALGFGATLALVAAAVLLPCLWIAGISVAVGFLRHSVRSAFRAAFIQVGALAGIACGIGLLWGSNRLVHLGLTLTWVLLLGGAAGLAGGVAAALLFNWSWTRVHDWIGKRYGPKPGGKASA
jgi:hypothetical protein